LPQAFDHVFDRTARKPARGAGHDAVAERCERIGVIEKIFPPEAIADLALHVGERLPAGNLRDGVEGNTLTGAEVPCNL
jgi:hypothetical protein